MAEDTQKNKSPRVVNAEGSSRYANKRSGGNNRAERKPDVPKEFEEITISIDRVARVVKGGRRFRFKALVAVGNKKNKVGVGVAKGQDVTSAVTKAAERARKNMITINLDKETIPHEVEEKVTGAVVLMKPAAPGTGVIAGGVVRSIIGLTGIKNLISKSLGSTNKVNIAYSVIKGLDSLVPKSAWHLVKNKKKEEEAK
jgi:small subunit ribosomal protein S5